MEADFLCSFTAIHNRVHAISAPRYQKVCLQHQLNMEASLVSRSDSSSIDIYIYWPEDTPSGRVTGHSEQEAEIPRLAGRFSLYPASLLGGQGGLSTGRAEHTPAQSTCPEWSSVEA